MTFKQLRAQRFEVRLRTKNQEIESIMEHISKIFREAFCSIGRADSDSRFKLGAIRQYRRLYFRVCRSHPPCPIGRCRRRVAVGSEARFPSPRIDIV